MKDNGLEELRCHSRRCIMEIIRSYTREAGVRNLEREIAKICRKVVASNGLESTPQKAVTSLREIERLSGCYPISLWSSEKEDKIGQVTGLAWTQVGGELLTIEAALCRVKAS